MRQFCRVFLFTTYNSCNAIHDIPPQLLDRYMQTACQMVGGYEGTDARIIEIAQNRR